MSTSNQQRGGSRRQPFGFLNANTIPSAKDAGGATTHTAAPAGSSSSDSVKNESKKFRGFLTSIVTRSRGEKNERSDAASGSSPEEDESMLKSPTKKNRVMVEDDDDSKPSATPTAAATLTSSQKQRIMKSDNEFAASDVAGIFRQRPTAAQASTDTDYWDDEMEGMLELKRANPILDESVDGEEVHVERSSTEGRADPSKNLAKELDESTSGEPLLSSNRVHEDKDGFKIHIDE